VSRTTLPDRQAHPENVLAMAWSTAGNRLVTIARDKTLRVFDPRQSTAAVSVREAVIESVRGARVLFVCDDTLICVLGYQGGDRQVRRPDYKGKMRRS